jgi:hypothetical protein
MGEVIEHVCGACGENHPHLLNISALFVAFGGYFTYIKCKTVGFCKKLIFILKKSTATTL